MDLGGWKIFFEKSWKFLWFEEVKNLFLETESFFILGWTLPSVSALDVLKPTRLGSFWSLIGGQFCFGVDIRRLDVNFLVIETGISINTAKNSRKPNWKFLSSLKSQEFLQLFCSKFPTLWLRYFLTANQLREVL